MPIEPDQLIEPSAVNPNSYRAKQAAKASAAAAAARAPSTIRREAKREAAAAAGRPDNPLKRLGRDQRERARAKSQEDFNDAVIANLRVNVETLQHLANGIWVREETRDGEGRVYRTPPDRQALMFLLEHGIGKATAREKKTASPIIQLVSNVPRSPRDLVNGRFGPKLDPDEEPDDEEREEPPFGEEDEDDE